MLPGAPGPYTSLIKPVDRRPPYWDRRNAAVGFGRKPQMLGRDPSDVVTAQFRPYRRVLFMIEQLFV